MTNSVGTWTVTAHRTTTATLSAHVTHPQTQSRDLTATSGVTTSRHTLTCSKTVSRHTPSVTVEDLRNDALFVNVTPTLSATLPVWCEAEVVSSGGTDALGDSRADRIEILVTLHGEVWTPRKLS
eukprot:PhM_4_TR18491/c1_g1_i2/m.11597